MSETQKPKTKLETAADLLEGFQEFSADVMHLRKKLQINADKKYIDTARKDLTSIASRVFKSFGKGLHKKVLELLKAKGSQQLTPAQIKLARQALEIANDYIAVLKQGMEDMVDKAPDAMAEIRLNLGIMQTELKSQAVTPLENLIKNVNVDHNIKQLGNLNWEFVKKRGEKTTTNDIKEAYEFAAASCDKYQVAIDALESAIPQKLGDLFKKFHAVAKDEEALTRLAKASLPIVETIKKNLLKAEEKMVNVVSKEYYFVQTFGRKVVIPIQILAG